MSRHVMTNIDYLSVYLWELNMCMQFDRTERRNHAEKGPSSRTGHGEDQAPAAEVKTRSHSRVSSLGADDGSLDIKSGRWIA